MAIQDFFCICRPPRTPIPYYCCHFWASRTWRSSRVSTIFSRYVVSWIAMELLPNFRYKAGTSTFSAWVQPRPFVKRWSGTDCYLQRSYIWWLQIAVVPAQRSWYWKRCRDPWTNAWRRSFYAGEHYLSTARLLKRQWESWAYQSRARNLRVKRSDLLNYASAPLFNLYSFNEITWEVKKLLRLC